MAKLLVIAEHDQGQLKLSTLSALGFAREVCAQAGGSYDVLILGDGISDAVISLQSYGAASILVGDLPVLRHPLADKYAQVIAQVAHGHHATMVVAAASTFSKDILPRSAALLDSGMLSDVVAVRCESEEFIFKRVMFAGNLIATVKLDGGVKFLTVRSAAFEAPAKTAELSQVVALTVDADQLPSQMEYIGRETKASGRPDSTEARVVVSGGRAIRNAEDFERMIGGLADVLGGAVGSSRALVDAGITPNSLQVGQTGKIVAPELYIAVGISGAIQHMAGMKDTKVIVAINKDPEAPIFEVADYGLVADAYQAVPELTEKLRK